MEKDHVLSYNKHQCPCENNVSSIKWVFFVVKGLSKYSDISLARELVLAHLASILIQTPKGVPAEDTALGNYYYLSDERADWFLLYPNDENPLEIFLLTITLVVESLLGIFMNISQKIISWNSPVIEHMGVENLNLKKNQICIKVNRENHYWNVLLNSEKLYYFNIRVGEYPTKTLPIPAGKCSIILDKLFSSAEELSLSLEDHSKV